MKHILAATCAAFLVGTALSASSADSGLGSKDRCRTWAACSMMEQGCPMMGSGAAPLAGTGGVASAKIKGLRYNG